MHKNQLAFVIIVAVLITSFVLILGGYKIVKTVNRINETCSKITIYDKDHNVVKVYDGYKLHIWTTDTGISFHYKGNRYDYTNVPYSVEYYKCK